MGLSCDNHASHGLGSILLSWKDHGDHLDILCDGLDIDHSDYLSIVHGYVVAYGSSLGMFIVLEMYMV